MQLSLRSAGLIRALLYPVQFEVDPRNGIDRVLQLVVERGSLDGTPAEYLMAIREALASNTDLFELIPQNHTEDVIRQYLSDIALRIENQWGTRTD